MPQKPQKPPHSRCGSVAQKPKASSPRTWRRRRSKSKAEPMGESAFQNSDRMRICGVRQTDCAAGKLVLNWLNIQPGKLVKFNVRPGVKTLPSESPKTIDFI